MILGLNVDVDLSGIQALEDFAELIPSRLAKVIEATGTQLVAEWSKEARIALKNPSGYVLKIEEGVEYPFHDDPLHYVVTNRHPAVMFLEEGVDPFDLKKMLETSSKVKISKEGKRYLRVPFKHSVESMESAGIDPREFQQLATSQKQTRLVVDARRRYEWGDRLKDMGDLGKRRKFFSGMGDKFAAERGVRGRTVDYTWKTSPFENVVRFKENHGSSYMTFRTISENSDPDSWIHPGIRATHIAEMAVSNVEPMFIAAVREIIPEIAQEAFSRLQII